MHSSLWFNDGVGVVVAEIFDVYVPVLPLYFAGVAWTLIYDTIYAHQDKRDDMIVGVKSTALRFGSRTKVFLTLFSGVMLMGLVATTLLLPTNSWWWLYIPSLALRALVSFLFFVPVASHLLWQIKTVNLEDPHDCARKFRSNNLLGALVFFALLAHQQLGATLFYY
jgi:4-hydroxybenzoate polyprenyltransferase